MNRESISAPEAESVRIPRYGDLNFAALWKEYPPAPEYFDGVYRLSRDALREVQEHRFTAAIARAWDVPFYQRYWGRAGIEPGDVTCLDDLSKLPTFSVHDLRESTDANPPWGDLIGIDPDHDAPTPLIFQTSGGTTGLPRVMMYTPRDREIMNIITGRRMFMHGVRPFDLVQVALGTGLPNAGLLLREAIIGYTGAVPIITGTGAQTPTARQIELMRGWGVDYLAATAPYMRHIAEVAAADLSFDVADLGLKGLICWLGSEDRTRIERQWQAPVYDSYGTNEFGTIATDCQHRSGMHIFEDAFYPELPESGPGSLVLTALFKHAGPMIRFDTNDVFEWAEGQCACGSTHRRLSQLIGRADNMVKFRATNIFPEAVGSLAAADARTTGEYICVLDKRGGSERLIVRVEARDPSVDREALAASLARRFRDALGATLEVDIVGKGELAPQTLVDAQTKARRLLRLEDEKPA